LALSDVDALGDLQAMGLELPSLAYIAGALIFGVFGWAAFRRGRKTEDQAMTWGGVALMVYPYAISQTWLLWVIGVGMTTWLFSRWR
jgi:hypothetical protein